MFKKILNASLSSVLAISVAIFPSERQVAYAAPSAVVEDYSVLPETFNSRPDLRPNILIVLDTSGSMSGSAAQRDAGFAFDSRSRSFQARLAMRNVLARNIDRFNVGLMTFGGTYVESGSDWIVACNDFAQNGNPSSLDCRDFTSNFGTRSHIDLVQKTSTRKGHLVSEIKELDQAHLDDLNVLLATEPLTPTSFNGNNRCEAVTGGLGCPEATVGSRYPIFPGESAGISSGLSNGTPVSFGGTPLAGTMNTARAYLTGLNDTDAADNFLNEDNQIETSLRNGFEFPDLGLDLDPSCRPDTFVFYLTDGLPTGNTFTSFDPNEPGNIINAGTTGETNLRSQLASALGDGIETWFFGFDLSSSDQQTVNTFADAGSDTRTTGFFATNASELEAELEAALDQVSTLIGSASGVSVITSSARSTGAVAQALYVPEVQDVNTVTGVINDRTFWTGILSMFFIDEDGNLREDNNGNGQLDDTDSIFDLVFNTVTQLTEVVRNPNDVGGTEEVVALDDLMPIWEAGDILSGYNQVSTVPNSLPPLLIQRPYNVVGSSQAGYRHILTSFSDRQVTDFLWSNDTATGINTTNFTMLAVNSSDDDVDGDGDVWDADDRALAQVQTNAVINFTRGQEIADETTRENLRIRDRTVLGTPHILGDILHSTTLQVDLPNESANLLFPQVASSYANFIDEYNERGRRRMVYVGANDGMIHAFNGGFFDPNTVAFNTAGTNGETAHDLGAEIWSFIPKNLLPHLKFVAADTYTNSQHVSLMDGPMQAFDVQIFDDDVDHPDGWGTILVAGMHLGGGEFSQIDSDANPATPTVTTRSSYVVLDITNPEVPPELIAEINHPEMGFTTSRPTIARNVQNNGDIEWALVMGSGPTEIQTSTSTRQASLFTYTFADDGSLAGTLTQTRVGSSNNSFVGDILAVDWDQDYHQEALYFGTVDDTIVDPSGAFYRAINNPDDVVGSNISLVLDTDQPVPFRANTNIDDLGNRWLLFGTGRLFDTDDFSQLDQNAFYGIKEILDANGELSGREIVMNDLVDVSEVRVAGENALPLTAGQLDPLPISVATGNNLVDTTVTPENDIDTFDELRRYNLTQGSGWRTNFEITAGQFSLRNTSSPLIFRDFLFYTTFQPPVPDSNLCTNEIGLSFLSGVDFSTGVPPLIDDFGGLFGEESGFFNDTVIVGNGIAGTSTIFVVEDGLKILTPTSTGEIADTRVPLPPIESGRKSWTEIKF